MNRRSFLKWLGGSAVVVATTDPAKLLEGLSEDVEVIGTDNYARHVTLHANAINSIYDNVLVADSNSPDGLAWRNNV